MKFLVVAVLALSASVNAISEFRICMKTLCDKLVPGSTNPPNDQEKALITGYEAINFDFTTCNFKSPDPPPPKHKFSCLPLDKQTEVPNANIGFYCVRENSQNVPVGKDLCSYMSVVYNIPTGCAAALQTVLDFINTNSKICQACPQETGCSRRRRSAASFPGFDISF